MGEKGMEGTPVGPPGSAMASPIGGSFGRLIDSVGGGSATGGSSDAGAQQIDQQMQAAQQGMSDQQTQDIAQQMQADQQDQNARQP